MEKMAMLNYKDEIFEEYHLCEYNLKLCERANSLLLNYLLNVNSSGIENLQYFIGSIGGIDFINNFSPIEQIFYIAYYIYTSEFFYFDEPNCKFGIPFTCMFEEELQPQAKVNYKDKNYIIDFVIDFTRRTRDNSRFVYSKITKLKYAIELDGYDYHSNKKQMQYDYERENNLKELGYSVVRFTGSQVYNEPYTCIDKLINIIVNDINKEIESEHT